MAALALYRNHPRIRESDGGKVSDQSKASGDNPFVVHGVNAMVLRTIYDAIYEFGVPTLDEDRVPDHTPAIKSDLLELRIGKLKNPREGLSINILSEAIQFLYDSKVIGFKNDWYWLTGKKVQGFEAAPRLNFIDDSFTPDTVSNVLKRVFVRVSNLEHEMSAGQARSNTSALPVDIVVNLGVLVKRLDDFAGVQKRSGEQAWHKAKKLEDSGGHPDLVAAQKELSNDHYRARDQIVAFSNELNLLLKSLKNMGGKNA